MNFESKYYFLLSTMPKDDYKVSSELYEEKNYISNLKPTFDQNNVVSKFSFVLPKPAEVDTDGDLVIIRKSALGTHDLEIEHSTSTVLNLVGLQIWRGSLLLADWLIYNNENLPKDRKILELGAGVGLTSIVAAIYRPVISTDINAGGLLGLINHNVSRNSTLVKNSVKVLELDFLAEKFSKELVDELQNVEIILAADVVYDDKLTQAFIDTIQKLLVYPKKVVYIALEKRYVFTIADCDACAPCYEYFLESLQKLHGVKTELVPIDFPQYFNYDRVKELVLWRVSSNV